MKNQLEIQLMKPIKEIEFETQLNYERIERIEQLRKLMRIYKRKNKEIYKSIHREYFDLIR
jgi:hypothetical protein